MRTADSPLSGPSSTDLAAPRAVEAPAIEARRTLRTRSGTLPGTAAARTHALGRAFAINRSLRSQVFRLEETLAEADATQARQLDSWAAERAELSRRIAELESGQRAAIARAANLEAAFRVLRDTLDGAGRLSVALAAWCDRTLRGVGPANRWPASAGAGRRNQ